MSKSHKAAFKTEVNIMNNDVKMYEKTRDVAFQIVQLLATHPEAFKDLKEALYLGMQMAAEETNRKAMVHYDGMIAALALSGKPKLDDNMKLLFHERIVKACEQQSCGYESHAVEKHTQAIKDIKNEKK